MVSGYLPILFKVFVLIFLNCDHVLSLVPTLNITECMPIEKEWGRIETLNISPYPPVIPGKLTVSGSVRLTRPFTGNIIGSLKIFRKMGFLGYALPIPCISLGDQPGAQVGTCNYTDVCSLIGGDETISITIDKTTVQPTPSGQTTSEWTTDHFIQDSTTSSPGMMTSSAEPPSPSTQAPTTVVTPHDYTTSSEPPSPSTQTPTTVVTLHDFTKSSEPPSPIISHYPDTQGPTTGVTPWDYTTDTVSPWSSSAKGDMQTSAENSPLTTSVPPSTQHTRDPTRTHNPNHTRDPTKPRNTHHHHTSPATGPPSTTPQSINSAPTTVDPSSEPFIGKRSAQDTIRGGQKRNSGTCPRILQENNIPCRCPFDAGVYTINPVSFTIPDFGSLSVLADGDFLVTLQFYDGNTGDMIMCQSVQTSIYSLQLANKHTTPCTSLSCLIG